jgi:CelD/BcsL family acetyltransferase involved in cellulose biosynthesis
MTEPPPAAEGRRHRRSSSAPLITSESFDELALEWTALHAAVPGATPFTHPAWHETWLRHFGSAATPVFLSIRDDERLLGVVTLDMQPDPVRELGDHNVRDYAGPLVLPGFEEAAATVLVEWLIEDMTPAVELWGIAGDSPVRAALAAGAARFGWTATEEHEANCPRLALPGDFESYVASLPKHDRHELRRKLRKLNAEASVSFESATAPDDVGQRFDRFLELMHISRGDKDEFLTPTMEAFFRDIACARAALGMARLSTLTVHGASAAMTLAFETGSTSYLYNSGYDPAFSQLAVGLLSKAYAIQDAINRGLTTFDFLRGDEDYKRHLGGEPLEVLRVRLNGAV